MQFSQLKRREFIKLIGGTAGWPLAARAQPAGQRLIGVLIGPAQGDPAAQSWFAAFQDALARLGWREGGNLRIELRWGAGDADRIGTLAKELVDRRRARAPITGRGSTEDRVGLTR
jgi:putative ABC transport system substrate-binding protein